ncbi:MAG: hypothetical protein MUE67_08930, partial [Anaerolineales bacterium]|nr:hypothetical protein [Anaerolineales bacterium]
MNKSRLTFNRTQPAIINRNILGCARLSSGGRGTVRLGRQSASQLFSVCGVHSGHLYGVGLLRHVRITREI